MPDGQDPLLMTDSADPRDDHHDAGDAEQREPAPEVKPEDSAAPAEGGESVARALEASASEPSEPSEPSDGEAHASDEGEGEGDEEEGGESESSSGDVAAAEGEGGEKKKKRRRRRRKKKGEATLTGETAPGTAPAPAHSGAHPHAHRREASQPFARFFEGQPRRAPFTAGDVVAGRVESVADGIIRVDLFGKAVAFVDELEPREVPTAPVEAPEAEDDADAVAAEEAAAAIDHDAETHDELDTAVGTPAVVVSETVAIGGAAGEVPAEAEAQPSAEPAPDAEAAAPEESAAVPQEPAEAEEHEAPLAAEPAEQLPPPEPPQLGEIFRGRIGSVAESGHVVIVNRNIVRADAKARLAAARDEKRRVSGVVFGFNRGGFDVMVEGIRAFCPASGMALEAIREPEQYVGKKLDFLVQAPKGAGKAIVVSRRSILERELRKAARERMKSLKPGDKLKGRVTQVREFGVFVDIGDGLEGLVHQSELSWVRGTRPADVAKPGDEVDVEVLQVTPATRKDRNGRVSLSMRTLQADPWDAHADVLAEGSVRKGRVTRTTDFGAFIELVPGIEGLLHITELGKDLKHAKQAIDEGAEIDVVIDRVDRKQRRISLSKLSPVEAAAFAEGKLDVGGRPRSLKPGSMITVVVERVEHGGVVVHAKGILGKRGRGFLPNRELGTAQSEGRRGALAPGAELEVKVIGVDREGGLRVSVKAKEVDEERRAVQDYRREASKKGFGTFGDLLRAKLHGEE